MARAKPIQNALALTALLCLSGASALAQESDQQKMRSLDEQVQEIKSEVLSISAELSQLEEKLLYPSGTEVAIFVALTKGDPMRLALRAEDGPALIDRVHDRIADCWRIMDAQIHRGPDDSGLFQNEKVVMGHRRLSIIDLSESGRQPMSNEACPECGCKNRKIWVTYNGEIYNYHAAGCVAA